MAIKLKTNTETVLPATLDGIVKAGMEACVLEKEYKATASEKRSEFKAYITKNNDGFDLTEKTLNTEYGNVTYVERKGYSYDLDKVQELIESGTIALTSLLQCCSFRAKDLEVALGSNFKDVSELNKTEAIAFKPSNEFKEEVLGNPKPVAAPKPAAPVAEKPAEPKPTAESVRASLQALKKKPVKKKTKKVVKTADKELDDILGQ